MYTTNEEDQRKAAALKARLAEGSSGSASASSSSATTGSIPTVSMDEGAHKYVLIKATKENGEEHFVVSSQWAKYHQNAAEPYVASLERAGYTNIDVLGGGRINLDTSGKRVDIFGFSYGFGQADHSVSKKVVQADPRYQDYTIETSSEGY